MKATQFLKLVVALWGDHWQKPCQAYLAEHGHNCTRQTLWNYKAGKRRVDPDIAALLKDAKKAK